MKKTIQLLALLFSVSNTSFAQDIRLHIMGGFANYSGDLQQKGFTLNQAKGVVTAGGSYSFSSRFAIRSDFSFAKLGADDKRNSNTAFRNRNLNFTTIIKELNLLGEYTIFDLSEKQASPYVFAGVAGYYFSPYTYTATGAKTYLRPLGTEGQGLSQYPDRKVYKSKQFAIPFGGGIKYALSDDINLGVELGFRKLFTDYLDDVSTTYVDETTLQTGRGPLAADLAFRGDELKTNPGIYPAEGTQRGNPKSKDLYYFGQFSISFKVPWFNGLMGARKNGLGCPTRVL